MAAALVVLAFVVPPHWLLLFTFFVGPALLVIIAVLQTAEWITGWTRRKRPNVHGPSGKQKTLRYLTIACVLSVVLLIAGESLVQTGGLLFYVGALMTVLPGIGLMIYAWQSLLGGWAALVPANRRSLSLEIKAFKHSYGGTVVTLLPVVLCIIGLMTGIGWLFWIGPLALIAYFVSLMPPFRTRFGAKADFYKAHQLASQGRLNDSLSHLWRYRENRPHDPDGWQGSAIVLTELGRYEEALEQINRAIELVGTPSPSALWVRADIYRMLGATDEALRDVGVAREVRWFPRSESIRATLLIDAGRVSEAIEVIETAIGRAEFANGFMALGDAYRAAQRYDEATAAYGRALQVGGREYTKTSEGRGYFAYCMAEAGQWEQAAAAIEMSRRDEGVNVWTLHAELVLAMNTPDVERVRTALEDMTRVSPAIAVLEMDDRRLLPLMTETLHQTRELAQRERDARLDRIRSQTASSD